ncbi:hypothetical protein KA005_38630, partial [bacterium]|nr:hypothetical protein [bacterium]
MIQIHNCHTHIFTIDHVPVKFLSLQLVRFLAKQKYSEWFARVLNNANPWSNKDFLSRYASFVKQGTNVTQKDILMSMMGFYPDNTRFVILTMDMEHMHAGKPKKSYIQQLDEIVDLLP